MDLIEANAFVRIENFGQYLNIGIERRAVFQWDGEKREWWEKSQADRTKGPRSPESLAEGPDPDSEDGRAPLPPATPGLPPPTSITSSVHHISRHLSPIQCQSSTKRRETVGLYASFKQCRVNWPSSAAHTVPLLRHASKIERLIFNHADLLGPSWTSISLLANRAACAARER